MLWLPLPRTRGRKWLLQPRLSRMRHLVTLEQMLRRRDTARVPLGALVISTMRYYRENRALLVWQMKTSKKK